MSIASILIKFCCCWLKFSSLVIDRVTRLLIKFSLNLCWANCFEFWWKCFFCFRSYLAFANFCIFECHAGLSSSPITILSNLTRSSSSKFSGSSSIEILGSSLSCGRLSNNSSSVSGLWNFQLNGLIRSMFTTSFFFFIWSSTVLSEISLVISNGPIHLSVNFLFLFVKTGLLRRILLPFSYVTVSVFLLKFCSDFSPDLMIFSVAICLAFCNVCKRCWTKDSP